MSFLLYLWIFAHVLTGLIVSLITLPPLKQMLKEAGAVKSNFRQREVVNMAGSLIVVTWVLLVAVAGILPLLVDKLGIYMPESFVLNPDVSVPLTLIIMGAGFFGLIDDLLGNRDHSGFRGHIGAILRGKLTTGSLKAIGIPIVAILSFSLISSSILEIFGDALLVALFVNTLNLLDLRPGRALKVYIPLQLMFIVVSAGTLGPSSAVLIGVAVVLLIPDLREEIMLGDIGSNILGGILGFCFAYAFDWNVKLPVVGLLVLLQLLTERYSISGIVERVTPLRALDNLGRRLED